MPSTSPSPLAQRLKDARRSAKRTQAEVAAAIGVSSLSVSYWERGLYRPSDENLEALASLYGVAVATLRYGAQTADGGGALSVEPGSVSAEHPVAAPTAGSLASSATLAAAWPAVARAREQELRAEAARAGLGDEELAAISRALRDLATAPMYDHGGRPRAMTDQEMLDDVEATAAALRAWITVRAARRRAGGA